MSKLMKSKTVSETTEEFLLVAALMEFSFFFDILYINYQLFLIVWGDFSWL